ncbi:hypothetical protein WR25_05374 [Diploscapter pachys]|uniref:Uncharacterized protein n=1 Tax=Diploscapter pachys TaxID=2018661 RepID=A0A2A2K9X1_9BILA|nr:hypothetical protein WR25_05374 [Diploscapter pachys]
MRLPISVGSSFLFLPEPVFCSRPVPSSVEFEQEEDLRFAAEFASPTSETEDDSSSTGCLTALGVLLLLLCSSPAPNLGCRGWRGEGGGERGLGSTGRLMESSSLSTVLCATWDWGEQEEGEGFIGATTALSGAVGVVCGGSGLATWIFCKKDKNRQISLAIFTKFMSLLREEAGRCCSIPEVTSMSLNAARGLFTSKIYIFERVVLEVGEEIGSDLIDSLVVENAIPNASVLTVLLPLHSLHRPARSSHQRIHDSLHDVIRVCELSSLGSCNFLIFPYFFFLILPPPS